MIGILLVSHGKMADGMKDSLRLVAGESEGLDTASLVAGQDFDAFREEVAAKIKALDQGGGVLVFVDLFGASPYNAAMLSFQPLREAGISIRVVTAMSLPMVMEAIASRGDMPLEELAQSVIEFGRDSIQNPVVDLLSAPSNNEDDGDY